MSRSLEGKSQRKLQLTLGEVARAVYHSEASIAVRRVTDVRIGRVWKLWVIGQVEGFCTKLTENTFRYLEVFEDRKIEGLVSGSVVSIRLRSTWPKVDP